MLLPKGKVILEATGQAVEIRRFYPYSAILMQLRSFQSLYWQSKTRLYARKLSDSLEHYSIASTQYRKSCSVSPIVTMSATKRKVTFRNRVFVQS